MKKEKEKSYTCTKKLKLFILDMLEKYGYTIFILGKLNRAFNKVS